MKHLSFGLVSTVLMLSILSGCQPTPVIDDLTTDVVVIGAGGAGLAAAITASDAGKNVIIVEKMPILGGNTIRATGGINAAGTSVQATLGIDDNADIHFEDTMRGGRTNNPVLVRILADQAADAVEWLIGLGVDLSDIGLSGGSTVRRTHRPTGGDAIGAHLVEVLVNSAREREVSIITQTEAIQILTENGNVVGVRVKDASKEYSIFASAVVLATGGFGADFEKLEV